MGGNGIKGIEAGKALGDAIAANTVLKELDISGGEYDSQKCDVEFFKGFSPGLSANGAMVSVNVLNNNIGAEQAQNFVAILKEHRTLKSLCGNKGDEAELDMSGRKMGTDGAIMLAPEIVANGAIVTVNIMGNKIGKEQLSMLQEMMQAHPTLVSLCGIADDATEAHLHGLGMDADDTAILADELPAKGALVKFDISTNMKGGGWQAPT